MKIYTNRFNANRPAKKKVYVAPWSDYKIGLAVSKNGTDVDLSGISMTCDGQAISADADSYGGFKTYTLNSRNESKSYVIQEGSQYYDLDVIVTDSTVFDRACDGQGGGTEYVLPVATATILGGVKIGDGLAGAADGTLSLTADIPTKTSDLTNDSGFITAEDIPDIPTKTSDLTNDSGFILSNQVSAYEKDSIFNNWLTGTTAPAIGTDEEVGDDSVTIGNSAAGQASNSIAIGYHATVTPDATAAIQIGNGTNSTPSTIQVNEKKVFDMTTGKIPNSCLNISALTETEWSEVSATAQPSCYYFITED